MKSAVVIAVFAAGTLAGGAVAAHEAFKPTSDDVQVRFVDPAAQVTTAPAKPSPSATKAPVKSKTVKVTKKSVPSKKATTRKATVQKSEANVATEPKSEQSAPAILPPPTGPANAPTYTAPTGVFGGPTTKPSKDD